MQSQYAYPAGAYFCSCKSRQNTLGAVPQDPLAAKLRLDTNDALASSVRRRRYALKVPAAHFILDTAETELNAACGTLSASSNPAPGSRRFGFPGGANGAPARSQDLVGRGGCTAAGRAARSKAQGQHDLSGGCVRRASGLQGGALNDFWLLFFTEK